MRLIGGHDYYDSALGMGQDPNLVFVRNQDADLDPQTVADAGIRQRPVPGVMLHDRRKDRPLAVNSKEDWGSFRERVEVRNIWVAAVVCGVLYHGIHLQAWEHRGGRTSEPRDEVVWSREQMARFLDDYEIDITRETPSFPFIARDRPATLEDYFAPRTLEGRALDFLIDNQIALMTRSLRTPHYGRGLIPWQVNQDTLKQLGFYRVMDPYAMFQELSMFVGGVLPRAGNDTVELDDRTRKAKHGFDQWSFRKLPDPDKR